MKTEELLVAPLLEERPTHPGRVAWCPVKLPTFPQCTISLS